MNRFFRLVCLALLLPSFAQAEGQWAVGPDAWVSKKPGEKSFSGYPPIDPKQVGVQAGDPLERRVVLNRLVLLLKPGAELAIFQNAMLRQYPNENIKFVGQDLRLKTLQVEIPPAQAEDWKKRFSEHPSVEAVFLEPILRANKLPDDPDLEDQHKGRALRQIDAKGAWEISQGDPEVVIAVVDSGFDVKHPELRGKIKGIWNSATRKSEQVGDEKLRLHGTHVAALAAGNPGNDQGGSGTCPNCSLLLIQAADEEGNLSMSSVVNGVYYAVFKGAQVVNLSLGFYPEVNVQVLSVKEKQRIRELIVNDSAGEAAFWNRLFAFAAKNKTIVVQAAGNDAFLAGLDPMKRSPLTLIVGSVGQNGQKSVFSNYGPEVGLSGPGEKVYSALPSNSFGFLDGTSMAAPLVAGVVGLIKSEKPEATSGDIARLLTETGRPVSSQATEETGPLVQAGAALSRLTGKGKASSTAAVANESCGPELAKLRHENQRLQQELADIKEQLSKVLVLPEDQEGYSFTKGEWHSGSNLTNKSYEPVRLLFSFDGIGGGRITFDEGPGKNCIAKLRLGFEGSAMLIEQIEEAQCLASDRAYPPYRFRCKNRGVLGATCQVENETHHSLPFRLYRETDLNEPQIN